ncbi:hypothetical protein EDB92DRAFT_2102576 [Lactarius akahatsu]|uniref:Uncharacterized protein n=1 Tax=Lactarius akahatsu TaxID=416441 RepID=A0AAD4QF26_9AGAM|nr:hypothetical protein EDB92DRAFT_2102576 [Lactarius akahatsu]
MYHDQQDASTSALLRPLSIDVATLGQPDAGPRSSSNEDAYRHRDEDQGVGTFQVPVPGGASILMKDSAGTSMTLNLGIDPSSGTPILSGRAIDAHGCVLDVHPCSCNDPVSLRHNFPGTPEHSRGGAHLRDSHLYPSPKSPFGAYRRPATTLTPLVVVQTLMTAPPSPSHPEHQGGESSAPVPETSVEVLRSPFTPTPASMLQRSQSPGSDTHDTFYTPPMGPEDTSNPSNTIPPLPSSPNPPSFSRKVRLNTIPEQILFGSDSASPLVQSPTSDGGCSDISRPSALGPLPSLPSSPAYTASERSTQTVVPHSHPARDVQLDLEEQLNAESTTNGPLLHGNAFSQGSRAYTAAGSDLGPEEGLIHPGTLGRLTLAGIDATSRQGSVVDSASDLYTDRVIAAPVPSMPIAIGLEGQELRYNLATQPCFDPTEEPTNLLVRRSGNFEGKWVANIHQDRMALTLDLTLDGLGMHNLSLSVPPRVPSNQAPTPEVRQASPRLWEQPVAVERADHWEAASESSHSVGTIGSSPSTAPPLSDLPLTPIPELLHTPTGHGMPITGAGAPERPSPHTSAFLSDRQHPQSKLPGPLDSSPIIEQLAHGESHVSMIRSSMRKIAREWQNITVMPDGVALSVIDDDLAMLYHALSDLVPVITLTWPLVRQPSLNTEGGQPLPAEFQLHLQHMSDAERKWYLKQHEFTASLQRYAPSSLRSLFFFWLTTHGYRNLTRLALLAQRVREDPDAAYRGNVHERITQFVAKFEDIALRLKLAHHIRIEQKYRVRVRHTARRAVASPEQVAAHEYNKGRLVKVRGEIEEIKRTLLALCDPRPYR